MMFRAKSQILRMSQPSSVVIQRSRLNNMFGMQSDEICLADPLYLSQDFLKPTHGT